MQAEMKRMSAGSMNSGDGREPDRCPGNAPVTMFEDGKRVCRGAGKFSLPRSLRTRSPHALCLCGGGSPAKGRAPRGARAAALVRLASGDARSSRTCRSGKFSSLRGGTAPGGRFRALHDQLMQLDRSRSATCTRLFGTTFRGQASVMSKLKCAGSVFRPSVKRKS